MVNLMDKRYLAEVNILDFFPKSKNFTTVSGFVSYLVNFVTFGGGVIVALTIIYAAFLYISAGGDQKKVAQAGNALFYGILGLVIILVAYWATQILARMIGKSF